MDKKCVKPLLETKFVKVYDLQYEEGKHYFDATRHDAEHLTATLSDEEFKSMEADAATCYVVIKTPGESPKLLLNYEYRYPVGQYLLSVPAGLVDDCDKGKPNALLDTAVREIKEETGITVKPTDRVFVINPCVFSTPGLTDESNGLVGAVIELDDLSSLNQKGAVGGEAFDGFCLVTKEKAFELIKKGIDDRGRFYPMYTLGALMWFAYDSWKEERG
ncbi:MAG: NUDIX hydrolase [Lachnospiraceae bacterium]|nr:NUDIX hydrolase [Lachnospiraceae bacterium]